MVATLLGNMAVWLSIAAAFLSIKPTLPLIFGIAALIAVIIMFAVSLAPHHTELTIEVLFTLTMIGIVLFFLFAIVGFPLWLFLIWWNGWSFPRWALWPCGALTVFIWLVFTLLKPTIPRDR